MTIPDGYVLIASEALQMVLNALDRDAEAGRTVRGEMAQALRESIALGQERLALAAGVPASEKGRTE